jgi:hypothetical protein
MATFDPWRTLKGFASWCQVCAADLCRPGSKRRSEDRSLQSTVTKIVRSLIPTCAGLTTAALMLLAACDGPQEQAGEKADAASGKSGDMLGSGPAEKLGARADDARESAQDATEARADALEAQADAERDAAEESAEALEQQADRVRDSN